MKELPGDVFVVGQITPEQVALLAGQGVQSFINNRPDGEVPGQPTAKVMREATEVAGAQSLFLPMAGMLTPELLERNADAYRTLPRPIVAHCASGTRSAALWAFAHAKELGVDAVMGALEEAGYPLPQMRGQIEAWVERTG